MRTRSLGSHACLVGFVLVVLTACHGRASTHVLFIGNSYTYINGGIDKQLEGLAPEVKTTCVVVGGYTLEKHWADGKALQTISQGGWDFVILQEQSQTPVTGQKKFLEFARRFDLEIKRSGAKTVLLMTWERPDSRKYGVTTANLAKTFTALGTELQAKIAPAGLTFERSLRIKPDLVLYSEDGHPTAAGTYLAACVLYETILDRSPVGNRYSDKSLSPEISAHLQRIAAAPDASR